MFEGQRQNDQIKEMGQNTSFITERVTPIQDWMRKNEAILNVS